jgi:hypothetical protein
MSDRKYRHRGYQDGGSFGERGEQKRPESKPGEPRPKPEGPRGRGLGAPTEIVFRCRVCGTKLRIADRVEIGATCSNCGQDLHTCSNCVNFDTARPNECRKPVLERISSKTKRNACEMFAPNTVQEFASDRATFQADPRAAFDALFKKK